MTGGTHSQGAYTAVLFEPAAAPHTFDASSEAYEFLSHDIKHYGRLAGHHGIRGTRARPSVRVRKMASFLYGTMHMLVSPGDLVTILPKALGAAAAGTTFSLDPDVPYFGMLCDMDYGVFEYKDCKIDKMVIRSRAPELKEDGEPDLLYLSLAIIGSDFSTATTWPVSPPSIGTTALKDAPLTLADSCGAVTINAVVRDIEEFAFSVNNFLYARYTNCLTPHSIRPRDREVSFACRVPWNSTNEDLFNMSAAGAAASLVFTNSTVSARINLTNLHVVPQGPAPDRGKQEVSLELNGFSTATGTGVAALECQLIVDSTP